jgi:hypothetical protein
MICERHANRMEIDSRRGGGTRVSLVLPFA